MLGLSDAGPDDLGFSTRSSATASEQSAGASAAAAVCGAFATDLRALMAATEVPSEARAPIDAALAVAPAQGDAEYLKGKGADEVVDQLVECRDAVRSAARDAGVARGAVMRVCDDVRDVALVDIGIKLEDKPGGGVWMRVDAAELRQEVCTQWYSTAA